MCQYVGIHRFVYILIPQLRGPRNINTSSKSHIQYLDRGFKVVLYNLKKKKKFLDEVAVQRVKEKLALLCLFYSDTTTTLTFLAFSPFVWRFSSASNSLTPAECPTILLNSDTTWRQNENTG